MRLCGAAITTLSVFGMTSGFAAPIERGADSAECKAIIARLLEATDASFDHYSPSGESVFFRSPKSVLSCTSYRHRLLIRENRLDFLKQCLALGKGCRQQGRHLEQFRRLGKEGRIVDDGLTGVGAQRQQLQILMIDQQERVIVGGK
jgi:hypothetical protein